MHLVAKEHLPLNTPMVIDEVGIEEIDTPSLPLRREAAQKQHLASLRQKGTQRMQFARCRALGDMFGVEPGDGVHSAVTFRGLALLFRVFAITVLLVTI